MRKNAGKRRRARKARAAKEAAKRVHAAIGWRLRAWKQETRMLAGRISRN